MAELVSQLLFCVLCRRHRCTLGISQPLRRLAMAKKAAGSSDKKTASKNNAKSDDTTDKKEKVRCATCASVRTTL